MSYSNDQTDQNASGFFSITRIHRDDLESIGFSTSKVTDDVMLELAEKMAEAYTGNVFWIDLRIIAEELGIPKLKKSKKKSKNK